jgi:hypothetical protein
VVSRLDAADRGFRVIHRRSSILFWFGIVVVLLLAVWVRRVFLEAFPLSPDEGIHLMWVRLIEAGYVPYSEVYITYPPLYPLFLTWSWKLWPTLAGLRWLTFGYAFLSVIAAALIARRMTRRMADTILQPARLWGDIAGIATAVIFTMAPEFVLHSRAILGEVLSVGWSVLAVWLAMVYRDSGRRLPLVLSAVSVAFSLLTKVLSPFIAPLVLFIVLARYVHGPSLEELRGEWGARRRMILTDLFLWTCGLLVPFILMFLLFDWGPLVQQVVGQRLSARTAYIQDTDYWASRLERLGLFASDNLWAIPLALLGLIETFAYRMKERVTLLAWFALAVLMLLVHEPIRYKHFTLLLPLLAIWSGVAIAQIWDGVVHFGKAPNWAKGATVLSLFFVVAYLLRLSAVVKDWQAGLEVAGTPADEQIALDFIEKVTAPNDCLITDDMQLVYWSGRLVPPELAEVSSNRLKAGELTLDELVAISTGYDCQVVAAVSNRIPKYLPDYMEWVKGNYLGRFHYGEDDLYVAKVLTTPDPERPMQVEFARPVRFLGYTFDAQNVSPGDRLPLVLYWRALATLDTDYTVFVHLRDMNNVTQASADHQPYDGVVPTTRWRAGAVVKDVVWLDLPADLPPGEYRLLVGMYRVDTLERLPVMEDTSGENAVDLGTVQIE